MAELRKRRLGRTGEMLAELGMGAMDTPHSTEAGATVTRALDLGIELFDTARDYEGSEMLLGRVLRERGGAPCFLASKTFSHTINGSQWDVDRSLKVLGVGQIDLYQLHDISSMEAWHRVLEEDGALAGLKVAQYRGLIRHIGLSSHSLEVLRAAIESGELDTVMLEYSAFFPDTAELIDFAAERDVGVVVMRPLGGSGRTSVMRRRVADGEAGLLTPSNLLRYVLANPGVSVAIPGARHPDRIEENVATAAGVVAMDEGERRALEAEARRLY